MSTDRIGPYEILDTLGSGGMGTVYRARHAETGDIVALKVLRTDFDEDPLYLRRFRREAEIARSLVSEHIVQTLDAGIDDNTPWIAMELVEGESLASYLRRVGALPVDQALDIASQVSQGLEVAHRQGVVHRDVSPQNILITRDGTSKIADFGVARSEGSTALTATAAFVGKPAYAAPEMFGGETDIRSDIYSLGVVLFEMLTGRAVFLAPTPVALMQMHLTEPPPKPSALGVRVPASVEAVIQRCLEKDPARRYQTPIELVEAMSGRSAAEATTVLPNTAGAGETVTMRRGRPGPLGAKAREGGEFWRERRWMLVSGTGLAAGAMALTLFMAGAFGGNGPGPSPSPTESVTDSPTPTPPPPTSDLAERLQPALSRLPQANSGFEYLDLQTGDTVRHGGLGQVPSASTIKALIVLEVERQVEAGVLDWEQELTVTQADVVGGTGVLQNEVGRKLTLLELVDTTLDYSDNTGGNMLIRLVGGFAPINELAMALDLSDTRMERYFLDFAARDRGEDNYTSVHDLAKLFSLLHNGQAVSVSASGDVMAKLARRETTYPSWGGRQLPDGSVSATINGLLPGERIEVSLVDLGGDRQGIIAIVLIDQSDEAAAEQLISDVVRDVYSAVSSTPTPQPVVYTAPSGYPIEPNTPTLGVTGTRGSRTLSPGGPTVRETSERLQLGDDADSANSSGWNCETHVKDQGQPAVDWYLAKGTPVIATMDGTATLFVITTSNAFAYYQVNPEPYLGNPSFFKDAFSGRPNGGKGVYVEIRSDRFAVNSAHLDTTRTLDAVPEAAFGSGFSRTRDYDASFGTPRKYTESTAVATWPVRRGDIIGYSGDSGYMEGPGIHYEVLRTGSTSKLCPTSESGYSDGGWLANTDPNRP